MKQYKPYFRSRRLKNYDYGSSGAYFLTLCTADRKNIFWKSYSQNGTFELSNEGIAVANTIINISEIYKNVSIDNFVIMPDHVHILLVIDNILNDDGRAMHATTVSKIVQQMKGIITKEIGYSVWQKSFHDHIIRNEHDYEETYNYINLNPIRKIEELYNHPRSVEHRSTK